MATLSLTLKDIVSKTSDLPSLPTVVFALIEEVRSPHACAESIAKILSRDQALAVKILRLANSSFYGMSRKVLDLREAAVILGMRSVESLAIVGGMYPWLSRSVDGYGLSGMDMWKHSYATGISCKVIAERAATRVDPERCFVVGLLLDMGKVAMSVWLEQTMEAILRTSRANDLTFDEVERKMLGYDHADVGSYLARNWNLPVELTEAIKWHHRPDESENPHPITDVAHLGDFVAGSMGIGLGIDGLRYKLDENSFHRLGIPLEAVDEVIAESLCRFETDREIFEEGL